MTRGAPDARPLAVLAAAATGLAVVGVVPRWAGLAHHVALPPLDLFADVRVLLAEAPSYPWFVVDLVVVVAVRSVALAAMLGALHQDGVLRSLGFYGIALAPALVSGGLGFAGVAAVYSGFLWLAVAVSVLALVAIAPLPWRPQGRGATAQLAVLGYLLGLLVVSFMSALGGAAVQVSLVWVSAGITALTMRWLAQREPHLPAPPVASTSLLLLLLVVSLSAIEPSSTSPARPGTLFLVPGIGGSTGASTMFRFDPVALGFDCDRTTYFSYAGTGDGAPQRDARCPITSGAPYRAEDTRRSIDELAASFRAQLRELRPPVVVVAHSQGGWVTAAGIDGTAELMVSAVILLGTFPSHRRSYVLDGNGAGVVGTDGLELLASALRGIGATSFEPRSPLAREHLGTRGAIDAVMESWPPSLRVATVTSAFDLPISGPDWQLDGATDLCPLYVRHGSLAGSPVVHRQIRAFLDGEPETCGRWRRWPTLAFTAFGAPDH